MNDVKENSSDDDESSEVEESKFTLDTSKTDKFAKITGKTTRFQQEISCT